MTIPYTREITLTAVGGSHSCVVLPVPPLGILTRLIVKQLSGALDGFSYTLYDRGDCCTGVPLDSLNPNDLADRIDPDLHRVMEPQTVTSGQSTSGKFNVQYPYVNRDERHPVTGQLTYALYLDLLPSGAGSKNFAIAYTVTTDHK